jgi:hypothetical protein
MPELEPRIDAIRILGEQEQQTNAWTSVSIDHARHVRIVATSAIIGTTVMSASETKYWLLLQHPNSTNIIKAS